MQPTHPGNLSTESGTTPFTLRSQTFLDSVDASICGQTPIEVVRRAETIVAEHDAWRQRCLNLNPAESGLTLRARSVLASDMAARLSEGLPGDKVYPHGQQNRHVDELEGMIIALARCQFNASYVEWRPVSTTMANAAVFFALLEPGDTVFAQDEDGGGNFSYHSRGPAGLAGSRILNIPYIGNTFEIDMERLERLAAEHKPKMIVVGGSNVLFRYPVRALREIADKSGAILVYDAAHLGLLISAGDFQRPLEEGAHVVTVSTHKIMGGPVGGLILTNDATLAAKILRITFPGFMQTRDQNKFASLVIALSEAAEFGKVLANDMVANARALAAALEHEGFSLLAQERGYTETHQIFLDLGKDAQRFESTCQAANMLVSDCALAGDMQLQRRTGSRIATHEITRLGLGRSDMACIATLMRRAFDGSDSAAIAREVEQLLVPYQDMRFSFDAHRNR